MVFFLFLPLDVRSPENGVQRDVGGAFWFAFDVVVGVFDVLDVVALDPFDSKPGVA